MVDTGDFDKRLEQREQTTQEVGVAIKADDDDEQKSLIKSNKPIRILKRPTSQTQLPVCNDVPTSLQTIVSNNTSSLSSNENTPVMKVPIQKNPKQETVNVSQTGKAVIKTYEQRELEYRLARLRIMGEEESSAINTDDDEIHPVSVEPLSTNSDKPAILNHPTPVTYPSNLIHFTPDTNFMDPYSQSQHHPIYSSPYPLIPIIPPSMRYPPATAYLSWYNYPQHQQQPYRPYGTPQYTHPQ